MVNHEIQAAYNSHRLTGRDQASFKRDYPDMFSESDLKEMEKKWKEEKKKEKVHHKSWDPEKVRTHGPRVSGSHGFLN